MAFHYPVTSPNLIPLPPIQYEHSKILGVQWTREVLKSFPCFKTNELFIEPKKKSPEEEKKEKVEALLEQIQKDQIEELFFVDEASFMTGPYVQRGWFKKGEKKNFRSD